MGFLSVLGIGAAIGGLIGGSKEKKPSPIDPEVAKLPPAGPVEKAINKKQFRVVQSLNREVADLGVVDKLYQLIDSQNMTESDRTAYDTEYADIKNRVYATGLEQSGMAYGKNIDDLVERGIISPDQGQKQKTQNEAGINAMVKIHKKKLDASRIRMARNKWMTRSGQNLDSAAALSRHSMGLASSLNKWGGTILQQSSRRKQAESNLEASLLRGNMSTKLQSNAIKSDFYSNIITGAASKFSGIYSQQQERSRASGILEKSGMMDDPWMKAAFEMQYPKFSFFN